MAGNTTNKRPHLLTNPQPPATTATVSFRGFFGCSDVNSVAIIKVAATDPPRKIKKTKKKKTPNWFSNWSTKKPLAAAATTVETCPSDDPSSAPAEETEAGGGQPTSKRDDGDTKSSSDSSSTKSKFVIKWTRKNRHSRTTPAADEAVSSVAAASEVPTSDGAAAGESFPKETITTGSPEKDNIVVGSRNSSGHTEEKAPNRATCKTRFPFCRNRAELNSTSANTGSSMSQPGTPVPNKHNPNGTVSISRSTTFPGPEHLDRKPVQLLRPPIVDNKPAKLDSVVGLLIITVTLVIMVVLGRFCAIVCTAAWLYFIPRLRTTMPAGAEVKVKANGGRMNTTESYESGGGSSQATDLDSVEYKRRVVLEGLLERKRRLIA